MQRRPAQRTGVSSKEARVVKTDELLLPLESLRDLWLRKRSLLRAFVVWVGTPEKKRDLGRRSKAEEEEMLRVFTGRFGDVWMREKGISFDWVWALKFPKWKRKIKNGSEEEEEEEEEEGLAMADSGERDGVVLCVRVLMYKDHCLFRNYVGSTAWYYCKFATLDKMFLFLFLKQALD